MSKECHDYKKILKECKAECVGMVSKMKMEGRIKGIITAENRFVGSMSSSQSENKIQNEEGIKGSGSLLYDRSWK